MKIKRSIVERIIKEELANVLREYLEEEPELAGADEDNEAEDGKAQTDNVAPKKGAKKVDGDVDGPKKPEKKEPPVAKPPAAGDGKNEPPKDEPADKEDEVPLGDDKSDDELEKDVEDADLEDEEGGSVSSDLVGKTVQSFTVNQDVKEFPGFTVIEVQFEDSPQPLRILVGKSGMIKFFYKGALHNEL